MTDTVCRAPLPDQVRTTLSAELDEEARKMTNNVSLREDVEHLADDHQSDIEVIELSGDVSSQIDTCYLMLTETIRIIPLLLPV